MPDLSKVIFHNADAEEVPYNGQPLKWRVSAYALIVEENSLLIIKNKEEKLYDIPGGGVELGETIEIALNRECQEEAGISVSIHELIHHKSDFFYHRELDQYFQTLQLFYQAERTTELGTPTDPRTVMTEFVALDQLTNYPLPAAVQTAVSKIKLS